MVMAPATSIRVSIIVAAYNAERRIRRAIDSALMQTESALEVLVVDDASTDGTAAVVAACAGADHRVRLVRMPVNTGPGAARNAGLAVARGDWVAILDADDRFRPERIERLCQLGNATSADMVADNLQLCPSGEPGGESMFPDDWLQCTSVLDATRFVVGNTGGDGRTRRAYGYLKPLIRRSFLETNRIRYAELRFAEDYIFYLRCLLLGARWTVTPEAMYEYTVTGHSATMAHCTEDLARLIDSERHLVRASVVRDTPALHTAIRRHICSVERALAWICFAEALKQRDVAGANMQLMRTPGTFVHIVLQCIRSARRVPARQIVTHLRRYPQVRTRS